MPPTLGNNPESESAEACLHLAMVNKLRMFLRTHLNEHLKASTQTLAAMFVENVQYTKEEVELIERQTVGQNENTIWHELRKGIITASQFRQVTSRANTLLKDPSADPTKTVDKILGEGTVPSEDLPALQWGRKKEGKAREMYRAIERRKHKHLNVRVPGLRVDDRRPFIGCSTDGVVTCLCKPKHQPKLLEIKCPFAWRDKSPKDAAKDKGCQEVDGKWSLTDTSMYYAQIQGQMGIYQLQECDLVIYTKQGIQIITVTYNEQYFFHMVEKLNVFFQKYVVPRLLAIA
ncbi:uncharacterized protein [Ptychodera flava]|uniref:uncharacterized protein n=1 Tax=Ptychodera flava TaxID=63121 RepID=UPI00396A1C3D